MSGSVAGSDFVSLGVQNRNQDQTIYKGIIQSYKHSNPSWPM